MNIRNKFCNKLIKFHSVKICENTGQRETYSPTFYVVFETMIGPINTNPYIYWLNKNVLPEVYSEPSQTSEMKFFVKIQGRHSELFLKIVVAKE